MKALWKCKGAWVHSSAEHYRRTWEEGSEHLRWRSQSEKWCIALLFCSTGPPWTSLLSFFPTMSPQLQFSLLLSPLPPCFQALFFFFFPPLLSYSSEGVRWLLVAAGCFLLGPLRVCSKSRQPLTAFAPDFIRNSGPYSRCFPPSVRNSIHQSGVVAPWGGRLNPLLLENTMLEVSRACISEDMEDALKNLVNNWTIYLNDQCNCINRKLASELKDSCLLQWLSTMCTDSKESLAHYK